MGLQLRRVPLDFNWPLEQVWSGFDNPLYVALQCAACGGDGYSPEDRHLKDRWYGNACAHCDGEGIHWPSAEAKQAYDDWKPTDPPKGEGYQIWETVSDGSTISPVFATPEELAQHMATTRWGADCGTGMECRNCFGHCAVGEM